MNTKMHLSIENDLMSVAANKSANSSSLNSLLLKIKPSSSSRFILNFAPIIEAAEEASLSLISTEPLVPSSPLVRSIIPTVLP